MPPPTQFPSNYFVSWVSPYSCIVKSLEIPSLLYTTPQILAILEPGHKLCFLCKTKYGSLGTGSLYTCKVLPSTKPGWVLNSPHVFILFTITQLSCLTILENSCFTELVQFRSYLQQVYNSNIPYSIMLRNRSFCFDVGNLNKWEIPSLCWS